MADSFNDPAALAATAAAFRRARERRMTSRSATTPGVERDAGEPPSAPGLPGTIPAAGDICGTTTTTA